MSEKTKILTPVGRIVAGDVWKGNDKDAEGRPLVVKTGPNAGQPRLSYYIGLAIAKNDPAWPALWATIDQVAKAQFPHLFDASGQCINPQFAFKVTDGDSNIPNTKGKKPCEREGYPGHWILNFSNGFAPDVYTAGGKEVLTDPNTVKRGYYVRIYGDIDGNGSAQQPGIYLNHSLVELAGYGEEIQSGPDGSVFAETAAQLPAGASATPLASQTTIAQGQAAGPGQTAPGPQTGGAPGPGATATAPPPNTTAGPGAGPSAPDTGFVQPEMYVHNGQAYTADQLRASGWNDQQIATLPRQ